MPFPPFSRRIPAPREPNALGRALAEAQASGRRVINLAESNPTRVGAALPAEKVLRALARTESLSYEPDPRGLPAARSAVASWYASRGTSVDPSDIFLAASTSEAYGWLFKLLADPGDSVLVPKPGYPLFEYLSGLEGVEAVPYPLEYRHPAGWSADLDSLEAALKSRRPKAVILIHPNNPTGSFVGRRERRRILDLCGEAGTAVIADEVFLPYPLEDPAEPSFARETEVPCFVLNGLSKLLGLPQMKLGWIVLAGPASYRADAAGRLEIIADTYLSTGAPILNAAGELLPLAAGFTEELRERLLANLGCLREALEGEGSPYRVLRCSGGWTAVLELPRVLPEEDLALGLLREEGVFAHPGYFFDFPREAFLALSLLPRPEDFREGTGRLRAFLDRLLA